MGKKEHVIKDLKIFAKNISADIEITKMVFFGSMATGKANRDSDIDLIIVSPNFRKKPFWQRSIGLHRHWTLDIPVDFLCLTPEEFDRKKRGITIVRDAVREGIEIA